MNKLCKVIKLVSILSVWMTLGFVNAQNPYNLVKQMSTRAKEIRTLRYEMHKKERVGNKMLEQRSIVKLQRQPFKVYTRQLPPGRSIEVLYHEGNETALVNPDGFPWFNLRLDPLSAQMTKDQHHTLLESGFDYFISILEHLTEKYKPNLDHMVKLSGSTAKHGKECWVLEFDNPYFSYIDHKVETKETVRSLAKVRKISGSTILKLNSIVDDYDDDVTGSTLKIPNDYSPKMILYIDKQRLIPSSIKVYDEKGLYEQYEFVNVVTNPDFQSEEFSASFSEYGF